jgi:YesN/AraC family two-component response regulator
MLAPLIFWIDFSTSDTECEISTEIADHYRVRRCRDIQALPQLIEELAPNVLCFDFDYPGPAELALLQKVKCIYPSVPILMLTKNHSTELVIWALRARVWDFFLKPVSVGEMIRRLNMMLPVLDENRRQGRRKMLMPDRNSYTPSVTATTLMQERTYRVLPYLTEHFHEKVALSDVAQYCRMGIFEFSRTFKREQGMTFRDYLVRLRVEAAAKILRNANTSVLDIACSVGINDPSQFSRLFRRHMGVTPTMYRNHHKKTGPLMAPCLNLAFRE